MAESRQNRPFFLMDSRVVESSNGVCLVVNHPAKAGPVLVQETPWESFYMHPHSLVRFGGEYLLYYLVYIVDDGPNHPATCLAVSRDGLCWERPDLGQVKYHGSTRNNMLTMGGTVSIDPSAPPERRFLMTGNDERVRPGDPGFVVDSLALHASPDGRVWTQVTDALIPFTCDCNNQVFYDSAKGRHVAYLRAFPGRRAVAYYEPPEVFKPWPIHPSASNQGEDHVTSFGTQRIFYIVDELPIAIDGSGAHQVYNPGVVSIEGMYLAFPDVFRIFPGPAHPDRERFPDSELYAWGNDGLVAPRFFISEDGISFRAPGGSPYIDLGLGDDLDTRQVRMVTGLVEDGDEIWQYYGGHQTGHTLARGQRPRRGCAVMRVVQRRDGFAGLMAGADGGEITTAPVECSGENLLVNYDAGAWGEVRAEIRDAGNSPIPGYSSADSAALVGNVVYGAVQWADRRDLGRLIGRQVRIRFSIGEARLFSFRFAPGPQEGRR